MSGLSAALDITEGHPAVAQRGHRPRWRSRRNDELAEDAANPHERLDGRGYFRGLSAEQLTPTARVLAVADVADALMSARPDREAMPIDEVLAVIKRGRTTEFCPASVAALAASLNSVAA